MRNKRCTNRTSLVAGSVVCLLTAVPAGAQIPQDYIVIDLGPLAGWSASDARALNEANQVIGYSADNASVTVLEPGATGRATLWHDTNGNNEIDPGEMIDLGTLRADNQGYSWAFDVNNAAESVGRATSDTLCPPPLETEMIRGFISSGIPPAHVLAPYPGIENGDRPPTGHGVNNATPTQIAGERETRCAGPAPIDSDDYKPLIWADGPSVAPIELPQPSGFPTGLDPNAWVWLYGAAQSLNDSAVVGGWFNLTRVSPPRRFARAIRWVNTGGVWQAEDISTLGGDFHILQGVPLPLEAEATDINNVAGGQICGWSDSFPNIRAFLWTAGQMSNLGNVTGLATDDSKANGLNDLAQVQVVGRVEVAGAWHAFIWEDTNGNGKSDPGEDMIDLNSLISPTSCWRLEQAWAINNSSCIVGFGTNGDGDAHGFLLKPGFVCPWDLNGDGCVDSADLTVLLGAWAAGTAAGDLDCDGDTDSADLTLLLGAWASGECDCSGQGAQGGDTGPAPLESALAVMGFANVADFQAHVTTHSDAEAFACGCVLEVLTSTQP